MSFIARIPKAELISLTESSVQDAIWRYCNKKKHEITVPNIGCCHGIWEADVLSVTRSLRVHEFEVKVSRHDFLKEIRQYDSDQVHGVHDCKKERNRLLTEQHNEPTNLDLSTVPNYFWFVCAEGIVSEDEIPPYAGFIEAKAVGRRVRLSVLRQAPVLHTGTAKDKTLMSMARGASLRYWENRTK